MSQSDVLAVAIVVTAATLIAILCLHFSEIRDLDARLQHLESQALFRWGFRQD